MRGPQQQQGPPTNWLPSKSGHPDDMRERRQPMSAMPVERVPSKDHKPKVNLHMADGEYYVTNGAIYHDGREALN